MMLAAAACVTFGACGDDDDDDGRYVQAYTGDESDDTDVNDIEFDTERLDEGEETIPADDNDYVENSTFTDTLYIVYNGDAATVSGEADGVDVTVSGAHVTVTSSVGGVEYVLSGASDDGSFKIYGEKKLKITLDGVTLTNPTGAVINDQCHKSMYLVLADDTENTLTDGDTYADTGDEDMKGTVFSEGQIIFSGAGELNINANCKNGIASDDYIIFRPGNVVNVKSAVSNGVKANDYVIVRGGVLNVGVTTAGTKGINSEGYMEIAGGRTTVITTGGTVIEDGDTKSCAGIKCDSSFTMTAGELNVQSSGRGGKGINSDADISISGGTVTVVTTGGYYQNGSYDASPKGIKADGDIDISGGDVTVTCNGGEGAEGIESKSAMTVTGGNIIANTYDDALNASTGITVAGGNVYACSTDNDGIDSNGGLYISGGLVLASGTTTPEGPFDSDNNTFSITGGTVIGIGGTTSTPTTASTTQPVILLGTRSYSSNTYIAMSDDDDNNIFAFLVPQRYSSAVLLVSSPEMTVGETYTFMSGVTVSGGTWWQGYSDDTAVSGGTTMKTVQLSSTIVSSGSSSGGTGGTGNNNGKGGGFGGGWW